MEKTTKWEKDAKKRRLFSMILAIGLHLAFIYYIVHTSDVKFDFFDEDGVEAVEEKA